MASWNKFAQHERKDRAGLDVIEMLACAPECVATDLELPPDISHRIARLETQKEIRRIRKTKLKAVLGKLARRRRGMDEEPPVEWQSPSSFLLRFEPTPHTQHKEPADFRVFMPDNYPESPPELRCETPEVLRDASVPGYLRSFVEFATNRRSPAHSRSRSGAGGALSNLSEGSQPSSAEGRRRFGGQGLTLPPRTPSAVGRPPSQEPGSAGSGSRGVAGSRGSTRATTPSSGRRALAELTPGATGIAVSAASPVDGGEVGGSGSFGVHEGSLKAVREDSKGERESSTSSVGGGVGPHHGDTKGDGGGRGALPVGAGQPSTNGEDEAGEQVAGKEKEKEKESESRWVRRRPAGFDFESPDSTRHTGVDASESGSAVSSTAGSVPPTPVDRRIGRGDASPSPGAVGGCSSSLPERRSHSSHHIHSSHHAYHQYCVIDPETRRPMLPLMRTRGSGADARPGSAGFRAPSPAISTRSVRGGQLGWESVFWDKECCRVGDLALGVWWLLQRHGEPRPLWIGPSAGAGSVTSEGGGPSGYFDSGSQHGSKPFPEPRLLAPRMDSVRPRVGAFGEQGKRGQMEDAHLANADFFVPRLPLAGFEPGSVGGRSGSVASSSSSSIAHRTGSRGRVMSGASDGPRPRGPQLVGVTSEGAAADLAFGPRSPPRALAASPGAAQSSGTYSGDADAAAAASTRSLDTRAGFGHSPAVVKVKMKRPPRIGPVDHGWMGTAARADVSLSHEGGPVSLFVVCDGHGGSRASDFVVEVVLDLFRARLARGGEAVRALWRAVADADAHFLAEVSRKPPPPSPKLLTAADLEGERPGTARSQSRVSVGSRNLTSRGSGVGIGGPSGIGSGSSGAVGGGVLEAGSLNRSRSQPDVLTGRRKSSLAHSDSDEDGENADTDDDGGGNGNENEHIHSRQGGRAIGSGKQQLAEHDNNDDDDEGRAGAYGSAVQVLSDSDFIDVSREQRRSRSRSREHSVEGEGAGGGKASSTPGSELALRNSSGTSSRDDISPSKPEVPSPALLAAKGGSSPPADGSGSGEVHAPVPVPRLRLDGNNSSNIGGDRDRDGAGASSKRTTSNGKARNLQIDSSSGLDSGNNPGSEPEAIPIASKRKRRRSSTSSQLGGVAAAAAAASSGEGERGAGAVVSGSGSSGGAGPGESTLQLLAGSSGGGGVSHAVGRPPSGSSSSRPGSSKLAALGISSGGMQVQPTGGFGGLGGVTPGGGHSASPALAMPSFLQRRQGKALAALENNGKPGNKFAAKRRGSKGKGKGKGKGKPGGLSLEWPLTIKTDFEVGEDDGTTVVALALLPVGSVSVSGGGATSDEGPSAGVGASGGGIAAVCAYVGDSRCVLCRGGQAVCMTRDHKASDPVERARVGTAGVLVSNGRVMNSLAVARAVGDKHMKHGCCGAPLVTSEAEVSATLLTEQDEFALLACDGAFDVMDCGRAIGVVRHQLALGKSPEEASKHLAKLAVEEGSGDNVSVVVVLLGEGVATDEATVREAEAGAALSAELDVAEEAERVRQEAAEEEARSKEDDGVTSALALEVSAPQRDGGRTRRAADTKGGFSFGGGGAFGDDVADGSDYGGGIEGAVGGAGVSSKRDGTVEDEEEEAVTDTRWKTHRGADVTDAYAGMDRSRNAVTARAADRSAGWDDDDPEPETGPKPEDRYSDGAVVGLSLTLPKRKKKEKQGSQPAGGTRTRDAPMRKPKGVRGVPLPSLPGPSPEPAPSRPAMVGGAAVDDDEYHSDSELTRDGNQTSTVAERRERARRGGGADEDAAGGFFGGGRAFGAEPRSSRDRGEAESTPSPVSPPGEQAMGAAGLDSEPETVGASANTEAGGVQLSLPGARFKKNGKRGAPTGLSIATRPDLDPGNSAPEDNRQVENTPVLSVATSLAEQLRARRDAKRRGSSSNGSGSGPGYGSGSQEVGNPLRIRNRYDSMDGVTPAVGQSDSGSGSGSATGIDVTSEASSGGGLDRRRPLLRLDAGGASSSPSNLGSSDDLDDLDPAEASGAPSGVSVSVEMTPTADVRTPSEAQGHDREVGHQPDHNATGLQTRRRAPLSVATGEGDSVVPQRISSKDSLDVEVATSALGGAPFGTGSGDGKEPGFEPGTRPFLDALVADPSGLHGGSGEGVGTQGNVGNRLTGEQSAPRPSPGAPRVSPVQTPQSLGGRVTSDSRGTYGVVRTASSSRAGLLSGIDVTAGTSGSSSPVSARNSPGIGRQEDEPLTPSELARPRRIHGWSGASKTGTAASRSTKGQRSSHRKGGGPLAQGTQGTRRMRSDASFDSGSAARTAAAAGGAILDDVVGRGLRGAGPFRSGSGGSGSRAADGSTVLGSVYRSRGRSDSDGHSPQAGTHLSHAQSPRLAQAHTQRLQKNKKQQPTVPSIGQGLRSGSSGLSLRSSLMGTPVSPAVESGVPTGVPAAVPASSSPGQSRGAGSAGLRRHPSVLSQAQMAVDGKAFGAPSGSSARLGAAAAGRNGVTIDGVTSARVDRDWDALERGSEASVGATGRRIIMQVPQMDGAARTPGSVSVGRGGSSVRRGGSQGTHAASSEGFVVRASSGGSGGRARSTGGRGPGSTSGLSPQTELSDCWPAAGSSRMTNTRDSPLGSTALSHDSAHSAALASAGRHLLQQQQNQGLGGVGSESVGRSTSGSVRGSGSNRFGIGRGDGQSRGGQMRSTSTDGPSGSFSLSPTASSISGLGGGGAGVTSVSGRSRANRREEAPAGVSLGLSMPNLTPADESPVSASGGSTLGRSGADPGIDSGQSSLRRDRMWHHPKQQVQQEGDKDVTRSSQRSTVDSPPSHGRRKGMRGAARSDAEPGSASAGARGHHRGGGGPGQAQAFRRTGSIESVNSDSEYMLPRRHQHHAQRGGGSQEASQSGTAAQMPSPDSEQKLRESGRALLATGFEVRGAGSGTESGRSRLLRPGGTPPGGRGSGSQLGFDSGFGSREHDLTGDTDPEPIPRRRLRRNQTDGMANAAALDGDEGEGMAGWTPRGGSAVGRRRGGLALSSSGTSAPQGSGTPRRSPINTGGGV